jgi:hypothetical protein
VALEVRAEASVDAGEVFGLPVFEFDWLLIRVEFWETKLFIGVFAEKSLEFVVGWD